MDDELRKAAQVALAAMEKEWGTKLSKGNAYSFMKAARALRAALAKNANAAPQDQAKWYCKDCRSTGLLHCSDPEHCGGMKLVSTDAQNSLRYKWLVDYSLAPSNAHDDAIVNAKTPEEFDAAIDAAMQQEQKP